MDTITTDQAEEINDKLDRIIASQNEIIEFCNNLGELLNAFNPASLPAPLRAMLGMGG